jgi:homoserine dehydrogenase
MNVVNVAVLGLGTVGQGVVKVIQDHADQWEKKSGSKIQIKRALEKFANRPMDVTLEPGVITSNYEDIVNDPDIHIVVEVIGGIEPARTFILQALKAGKSVVTANKDLLAVHGQEIFQAAKAAGQDFFFEASVGGAIPIIGPLRQSLIASDIVEVMGIVNGTTNYILTRMTNEGGNYSDILRDAQALGYAEVDPTADVDGIDAARKVAILATLAFHSQVTLSDVYIEGIKEITPEDIYFANKMGFTVKLLGICRCLNGSIEARVHPALVPLKHPLALVNDTFNAIYVKGDAVGDTMFYGRGAGRMPTASAIVGDIIEIVRNMNHNCLGRLNSVCDRIKEIKAIDDVETCFFLRMILQDKPGVLAQLTKVLGDHNVSLATVLQTNSNGGDAELVFVTHKVKEGALRAALEVISALPVTRKIITVLRVEGEAKS